ncbi:Cilia- and flagella-associated protein [Schistosoma japonicum]|nr:Cilia- and flagella-associated protein [Schistosoma japonicum]
MTSNPFLLPKFENIFQLRDAEKEERLKKAKASAKLAVFEKIQSQKKIKSRRSILEEIGPTDEKDTTDNDSIAFILNKTRRQFTDRETRDQFVANRREMFFLEYLIAVQRSELKRLEELGSHEDQKLELAEQCLEQDAALFDEFLKENDKSSVEAVANSEQEARKRGMMVDKIKQLTVQKSQINAEIIKLKETVKDYKYFKAFLERLIPEPYYSQRQTMRRDKKELKYKQKLFLQSLPSKPSSIASNENSIRRPSFVITKRSSLKPTINKALSIESKLSRPITPYESSSSEDSDDEVYFKNPNEILTSLRDLEEANLRLIQHCQESDDSMEILRNQVKETVDNFEKDIQILSQHQKFLKDAINSEENKTQYLSLSMSDFSFAGYNSEQQKLVLNDLHEIITEVYHDTIRKSDTPLSSIQMLYEIEVKLIDLLEILQTLPQDEVNEVKQAKEIEHRQQIKEEKKHQQRLYQEERIQKALERAKAAPKKQIGRRLMTRSQPAVIHKLDDGKLDAKAKELKELAFLFE